MGDLFFHSTCLCVGLKGKFSQFRLHSVPTLDVLGWWVAVGGFGVASWPFIGGSPARLESGMALEGRSSFVDSTAALNLHAESFAYCSQLSRNLPGEIKYAFYFITMPIVLSIIHTS